MLFSELILLHIIGWPKDDYLIVKTKVGGFPYYMHESCGQRSIMDVRNSLHILPRKFPVQICKYILHMKTSAPHFEICRLNVF